MNARLLILLPCLFGCTLFVCYGQKTGINSGKLSLDNGWLFHKGDLPFPPIKGHGESYLAAKAGAARGAAAMDYDDTEWASVQVPHDWAMEENVDTAANLAQGYRHRGFGWYRRRFKLDAADRGKNLELQFEGIATHATIWVNGQEVYHSYSAYASIYIDISAIAKYGDEVNTIAIRVDAESMEGWWYEGAGIYRHTWLVKRPPVHISTDGVHANPVKSGGNNWMIPAEVTVCNNSNSASPAVVRMVVYDKKGKQITAAETTTTVQPLEANRAKLQLAVTNPELWDLLSPALYTIQTTVTSNSGTDEKRTTCGFRTFRFDADSGFYLNNRRVKIKGVCNHIDHAGVGTALPDALWAFRMDKIKELGANAYRCAHNPPTAQLLDLCDSLGILVMDENRNFNTAPEYLAQLQWMVRRDRNHPSIILWSVFNEEPIQGSATGYEMVRRMAKEVKRLDTTRPVTAAMNGGFFEPVNVSQAVDVTGFNYEIGSYDRFHQENPAMPVTSSEDASAVMIRGEYTTDRVKHLLGSYDTESPPWGATHRRAWKVISERPWMAGCFVWTGFDYHGEPTPFSWPTVNSSFGIMDLCGFPKAAYYLRQAQWIDDKPVLHLLPHWSWPKDSIGRPVKVMALSNADKIQLFLNGKLVGEKQNDRYEMVSWEVPYEPGKLEAIGYKNNKVIARFAVETTGPPVSLRLTAYKNTLLNDGRDVTPVTVEALDAAGRHVPVANMPVTFTVNGEGQIIGLGNGNPNSHEPEKGDKQSLFNGLAQVIVQSKAGAAAPLVLTAAANGFPATRLSVVMKEVAPFPAVAAVGRILLIDKWRMSPWYNTRPDPNMQPADNDMNSWQQVKAGTTQKVTGGRFAVYRAAFSPDAVHRKKGGMVVLKNVTGKAEVWMDGKRVAVKTTAAAAALQFPFAAGDQKHTINILVEEGINGYIGLGAVEIE
jgi:beta-galactosidase